MVAQKIQYWSYLQAPDVMGNPIIKFICQAADPKYADPDLNFTSERTYTIASPTDAPNNIYATEAAAETAFLAVGPNDIVTSINIFFSRSDTLGDIVKLTTIELDALALKANTTHTHVANDITSGTKTSSFISDFQTAARNAISVTGNGSYNASTGVVSINGTTFTFGNPTRALNTAFQISANQNAIVTYSVDIACNLSLSGGQKGTVYLEYADNSGMTTNLVTVQSATNSQTGTLTIGLNTTGEASAAVSGVIPAGKYVRLRTENNTGTPTFTYRRAQEVLAA